MNAPLSESRSNGWHDAYKNISQQVLFNFGGRERMHWNDLRVVETLGFARHFARGAKRYFCFDATIMDCVCVTVPCRTWMSPKKTLYIVAAFSSRHFCNFRILSAFLVTYGTPRGGNQQKPNNWIVMSSTFPIWTPFQLERENRIFLNRAAKTGWSTV